jgi:hypothetical protein
MLRVRIPDQVVFRTFVSETVVLNLTTGRYHGLNTTAGRIMELFRQSDDAGTVADRLSAETGQPLEVVEQDLSQLCRDLVERGLIEVDGGG